MIDSINDINNQFKPVKKDALEPQNKNASQTSTAEDSVELSDASQQMAVLMEIVQQAADVNQRRVDEIKQQINIGKYEMISHNIAERMLSEMQTA